ncbi:MAG: macro domain-containing protein [Bacillota bacterium]|nr:macro domain-containing protein [Bacillota bacterium]
MITALLGDITRLDFEIVAIPVDEEFEPVNAISRAIYEKMGEELKENNSSQERGKIGFAHMIEVNNPPFQNIIRVVPPVYIDGEHNEAQLLKAVYWNSMVLAFDYLVKNDKKHVTLAFSSMHVAGRRFPFEEAAHIAVSTIREMYQRYWDSKHVDVVFVCDRREDYACLKKEIRQK